MLSLTDSQLVMEPPGPTDVNRKLTSIHNRIRSGAVDQGMAELFRTLRKWRTSPPSGSWEEVVTEHCLKHPVSDVIYEDPMTFHSYSQPRGYPGDAELLDYIYGIKQCNGSRRVSSVGQAIHDFLRRAPSARAVRTRRGIVAALLDRVARAARNPRVLSIAAGHLREAELSSAVQRGLVAEYIAFDQDERSLRQVERDYSHLGVEVDHGSVRDLLTGRRDFQGFDCVYAAGLYDYLQQKTARRLTRVLFDALRTRGRLLIANFLPDISDAGFMESYMGWNLTYRSRVEILDVTADLSLGAVEDIKIFTETNEQMVFLEIQKR